jgi:hypothetical protein
VMTIEQTNKIDFVTIKSESNEIFLSITDHLDWAGEQKEHLWMLQEKINAYLRFIESGEMEDRYQDAKGRSVVIRVVGKFALPALANEFYLHAKKKVGESGIQILFELFEAE